jgi:hypothetical protein
MSVSTITRTLDFNIANAAYEGVCTDIVRTCTVPATPYSHLISNDPRTAGSELHALLGRMSDHGPLCDIEKAYLPWVGALRAMLRGMGVLQMENEVALSPVGCVPNGVCDLLVHGGPQPRGAIEVKLLMRGTLDQPRGRNLAQVGSYARLIARHRSFDTIWAAVAYVEIEARQVQLFGFSNSRQLVTQTLELLRAA